MALITTTCNATSPESYDGHHLSPSRSGKWNEAQSWRVGRNPQSTTDHRSDATNSYFDDVDLHSQQVLLWKMVVVILISVKKPFGNCLTLFHVLLIGVITQSFWAHLNCDILFFLRRKRSDKKMRVIREKLKTSWLTGVNIKKSLLSVIPWSFRDYTGISLCVISQDPPSFLSEDIFRIVNWR